MALKAAQVLCFLALNGFCQGGYPGHGLSKSTYSCNDPIAGLKWLSKYFPVETPGDECSNNICDCGTWEIQQGRVYTKRKDASGHSSPAGNGFGLHLVNVSAHLTTGGKATAEVEAQFTSKLGDMSKFDSFMDYNVILSTDGLAQYKETFKADSVKYLAGTWTSSADDNYTSIIVQVPGTQMILELVEKTSLTYLEGEAKPIALEQRVPSLTLQSYEATKPKSLRGIASSASTTGSYITALAVGRAASANAMAKLEDFYVDGMGTTMSHNEDKDGVVKKCFRWSGATMDVCYTQRADSATKGDWKVSDFENMLNTVHKNLIDGHPLCEMDKWEDNHYAIDSFSADTSKIIKYVNKNKPYHTCATGGPPGSGSSYNLHYIFDPTGWGIQLDMAFSKAPDDCKASADADQDFAQQVIGGHQNPACTLNPTKCGASETKELVI